MEYYNYNYHGKGFCFDLEGYGIPDDIEYALVYYVDPPDGVWDSDPANWPEVYVLGISEAWHFPARWKFKGLLKNFKIKGCCDIESLPVPEDTNYPNGGKLWLIPTQYLTPLLEEGELAECAWARMGGWPADVSEILFETSLITYGFGPSNELIIDEAP